VTAATSRLHVSGYEVFRRRPGWSPPRQSQQPGPWWQYHRGRGVGSMGEVKLNRFSGTLQRTVQTDFDLISRTWLSSRWGAHHIMKRARRQEIRVQRGNGHPDDCCETRKGELGIMKKAQDSTDTRSHGTATEPQTPRNAFPRTRRTQAGAHGSAPIAVLTLDDPLRPTCWTTSTTLRAHLVRGRLCPRGKIRFSETSGGGGDEGGPGRKL